MLQCSGKCLSADEAQAVSLPGTAFEGDGQQDSAAIVVDEPLKAQDVSESSPAPEEKAQQGPEGVMSIGAKVRNVSQTSPPICSSNIMVLTLHLLLSFPWAPLHTEKVMKQLAT